MTIGYQARMQFNAAKLMTNYGSELNNLYNSYTTTGKFNVNSVTKSGSTDALNKLLDSKALKNKSDEFRTQFSNLYKNIYNIKDDSESSDIVSPQALKTASANVGGSAEAIRSYADKFKYGKSEDFNIDEYKSYAQNFVDNYNAFIDKIGNSDNTTVLKKGVLAVNNAKVYTSALNRAGITLGSDNKLTLQSDLSKVDMIDVKSTFGKGGFSDTVIRRAREINEASGGMGIFTSQIIGKPSESGSSSSTETSGSLKELTSAVKDVATAVKSYSTSLGSEEKSYSPVDYTDTATSFIEKYNKLLDETDNSDKLSVQYKGNALKSVTNSYKYALKRAGIEIGKDGRLSLSEQAAEKLTANDLSYAFNGSYIDKVNQKAEQISSLATSASAMGYTANSTASYAYNSGALFSIYA